MKVLTAAAHLSLVTPGFSRLYRNLITTLYSIVSLQFLRRPSQFRWYRGHHRVRENTRHNLFLVRGSWTNQLLWMYQYCQLRWRSRGIASSGKKTTTTAAEMRRYCRLTRSWRERPETRRRPRFRCWKGLEGRWRGGIWDRWGMPYGAKLDFLIDILFLRKKKNYVILASHCEIFNIVNLAFFF